MNRCPRESGSGCVAILAKENSASMGVAASLAAEVAVIQRSSTVSQQEPYLTEAATDDAIASAKQRVENSSDGGRAILFHAAECGDCNEIQALIAPCLAIYCFAGFADSAQNVMAGGLRGLGKQDFAAKVILCCFWGLLLPLAAAQCNFFVSLTGSDADDGTTRRTNHLRPYRRVR